MNAVREVDLLSADFRRDEGILRQGLEFQVTRPWAIARFGSITLFAGWWVFECDSASSSDIAEVRLTSGDTPLVVFSSTQTSRIFLRTARAFDISLFVSAWPGQFAFRKLRLRHQSLVEDLGLFRDRLLRLARSPDRWSRVARIVRNPVPLHAIQIQNSSVDEVRPAGGEGPQTDSSPSETVTNWMVDGDIAVLLGHQDKLDPCALPIVRAEFERRPRVQAVYCDVYEDTQLVLRPDWNPELFRYGDFAGVPLFVRHAALTDNRDPRSALKHIVERFGPDAISNVALPLAKRPSCKHEPLPSISPPKLSSTPKASIVIPTKFRIDLLDKCLEGLRSRTDYPDLEVIVVNNGSTDPRLRDVLARASEGLRLAEVFDAGDFNFPRLINGGVKQSSGDILVLLNDDVEPVAADWLRRMVDSLLASDVGAVGARLVYPDGSLQHAGAVMGIGGICGHLWKGMTPDEASRSPYVAYPGQRLAVTGACLAVRRQIFDQVGGLDENYPVSLNDIDFCLRVHEAGYRNIYRGDAVLVHHESQSRGKNLTPSAIRQAASETGWFLSKWRHRIEHDPFGFSGVDIRTEEGLPHRASRVAHECR